MLERVRFENSIELLVERVFSIKGEYYMERKK